MKPETLKSDIADGIYVKFQLNPPIFCIEHSGTNVSTGRRHGGWKIKDGGIEPEVDMKERISQLAHMIATQFQRLHLSFDVKQHDWTDINTAVCQGEWEIKDAGLEPEGHMK